jgi:hypothetical protein
LGKATTTATDERMQNRKLLIALFHEEERNGIIFLRILRSFLLKIRVPVKKSLLYEFSSSERYERQNYLPALQATTASTVD